MEAAQAQRREYTRVSIDSCMHMAVVANVPCPGVDVGLVSGVTGELTCNR